MHIKTSVTTILLSFVISSALLIPGIIHGAVLSVDSSTTHMGLGQQFLVDVVLDTQGESINAVQGNLVFAADMVEVREIRDGDSIINFWIERPAKTQRAIIFSGITPGGYAEKNGKIFSVVMQAKKKGNGIITLENAKALRNNGLGTEARLAIKNLEFGILNVDNMQDSKFQIPDLKSDVDPPEPFIPEIARDKNIFNDKWFVVFATQDKGSGIDHYEVLERRSQKIESRIWREQESPYLLQDQTLRSYISVKAVDKAGHERIAEIAPPSARLYTYILYAVFGILGVGIIGYVARKIWRKRRRIGGE